MEELRWVIAIAYSNISFKILEKEIKNFPTEIPQL